MKGEVSPATDSRMLPSFQIAFLTGLGKLTEAAMAEANDDENEAFSFGSLFISKNKSTSSPVVAVKDLTAVLIKL